MAEIINLNRFRKQKQRAAAAAKATENRAKHGRTKVQKERDVAAEEEARKKLDLLKREEPEPET